MLRASAAFAALLAAALALPAAAQQAGFLPEKAMTLYRDLDFYGQDIGRNFDTTMSACRASCLAREDCRAFTFNTRAKACFLKSGVGRVERFDGAISARFRVPDEDARALAADRAGDLGFMPQDWLTRAREVARTIGGGETLTTEDAEALSREAYERLQNQALAGAAQAIAAALAIADRSSDWVLYARIHGADAKAGSWSHRRDARRRAAAGAVNAYLRAEDAPAQAIALEQIAMALEADGRGRQSIDALRLAVRLAARAESEKALERAVSLFGFRILEHQVDSDAAQPRICLNFSETLDAAADYGPYLAIDRHDLPVEAEGQQLCIDGVVHGERYRITAREGLPAASGEVLMASSDLTIYVRDRSAAVSFPGRTYVLPRSAEAGLPILTVNLEEVELRIHRVGDRNLLPIMQNDLFGEQLSGYDEGKVTDRYGEAVWEGTGVVEQRLNEDVLTTLPLGDEVPSFEPGVYVATARVPNLENESWDQAATQWFVVTDLGLATLSATDGLHVIVRALSSAEPVAGAEVKLLSTSNEVLGTAVTDGAGYANFAPGLVRGRGSLAPAILTAQIGDQDYAFLALDKPAFDLSDRGVGGRAAPGPIDIFATTERGAYRPGETVHATLLARDARADAIGNLPVTAIVTRPDGVEASRTVLLDAGAGGRTHQVALGGDAMRGTWRMALHVDVEAPALASVSWLVEDFVPERIDVELDIPEGPVNADEPPQIGVQADYLYGAPGGGLEIEGEIAVAPVAALPGFAGYRFGDAGETFTRRSAFLPGGAKTGPDGRASIAMELPEMEPVSRPLEVTATIRVRDDAGRPVERSETRPMLPTGPMIGIRPDFEGTVEEGSTAGFDLVAVGAEGTRISLPGASWTISRITTRYQWYESDGRWNYQPITRRERIAAGTVDLAADGAPVRVSAQIDWGRYELKVTGAGESAARAAMSFSAGWYRPEGASDTPDLLEVGLDREAYALGDTVKLRLRPRAAGKVMVMVLDNRVIEMRSLDVEAGETEVQLTVTEEWGPGAYVVAHLVRPLDAAAGRVPARALGLGWASVEPGDRRIEASLDLPETARPRQPLEAVIRVANARPGEQVYATVAAVDLGILNLTGFEAPKPDAHYLGQRALGAEIRDLYGRLIDGSEGTLGRLRSGGDALSQNAAAPPPTEDLVAFFSGIVEVGADGTARVAFDIPAFNGTVRFMGVFWSAGATGHAVKDVIVRDPVVISHALPRFLAPGDESRIQIDLAHAEGPAGLTELAIEADDALALPALRIERSVELDEGGRARVSIPVTALGVGNPEIRLTVTTPGGERLTKTLRLPVRINDPVTSRRNYLTLAPGGTLTLDAGSFSGFRQGTGRISLAAGTAARFDAAGLLTALDRYPYGCTEQTVSRALPLLYFDEVADAMGLDRKEKVSERIERAIRRTLARQSSTGGFGLWRPGSGDLWLDAYVTDFLGRAKATGHGVPALAYERALENLSNRVAYAGDFENGGQAVAYALMVLAREGMASIGDLRYYADAKGEDFATPLAQAQLGWALAAYGEQRRADAMFRLAASGASAETEDDRAWVWRSDYGSSRRDAAGVLALSAEARSDVVDRLALAAVVAPGARALSLSSTQEKVWTLLAAHALVSGEQAPQIAVNGALSGKAVIRMWEEEALASGAVTLENRGDKPVEAVLTTFGVPLDPEPAGGTGYRIERGYFTLEGDEADPRAVRQNDRLLVVLTVYINDPDRRGRLMVDDPLPAGFEIDNPNLIRAGDVDLVEWLTPVEDADHTEFRTDRFRAAVSGQRGERFQLAYVVRAVSPGAFHHPAASVEDMYRPELRARSETATVLIDAAR